MLLPKVITTIRVSITEEGRGIKRFRLTREDSHLVNETSVEVLIQYFGEWESTFLHLFTPKTPHNKLARIFIQ